MKVAAAAANLANGLIQRTGGTVDMAAPSGDSQPAPDRLLQAQMDRVYSTDWSPEDDKLLEAGLAKFPEDKCQPLERYVRIAATLVKKGVRDVALRTAWMNRGRASKRKAALDDLSKNAKAVRRERGQSIFAVQPKLPPGSMPNPITPGMPPPFVQAPPIPSQQMQLDDHGSQTVGGVGGPIATLLEQNYAILNQFKTNMAQYKVNENTELLVRFRDNILSILNQMNSMQGVMSQMPALPVRLNVDLANNFLGSGQYSKAGGRGMFPMMPMMPMPMGPMPMSNGGYMMPGVVPMPVATSAPQSSMPPPASQPQKAGAGAATAQGNSTPQTRIAAAVAAKPPDTQTQRKQEPVHEEPVMVKPETTVVKGRRGAAAAADKPVNGKTGVNVKKEK